MEAMFSIETEENLDELLRYLMENISDEEIDGLELEKITEPSKGIAYEPVTVAAVIVASTPIALAVLRLLERFLQDHTHHKIINLVWDAGRDNPALSSTLASLGKTYAGVEAKQGLISGKR